MNVRDKTIIVTGASEGIGKEIALALAKRGSNLALVARNQTKLNDVLSKVKTLGSKNSKAYVCDLQKLSDIKSTVKQILSDFPGSVIGLVNNAGIWQKKAPLENISDEELTSVIEIDLLGHLRFTKELLTTLKAQPEAAIINISSRSGISAAAGQSVYSAAKWGMKGFTQVLKEDLVDTNVHVSGIYQGGTNTDMFSKAGEIFPPEKLAGFIPAPELGELIAYMFTLPKQIWLTEVHVEKK